MAQDFARQFYNSKVWKQCRQGFMANKHYVCERCGGAATIAHHKQYLSPRNIHHPQVTLNWNNLEALCQDCHNIEHMRRDAVDPTVMFDENGNLIKRKEIKR